MRLSLGKTVVFLSMMLSLTLLTGCSLETAEMEKNRYRCSVRKEQQELGTGRNLASGKISGACNLYSGTDERG